MCLAADFIVSDVFLYGGMVAWVAFSMVAAQSRKPEVLAVLGISWVAYIVGAGALCRLLPVWCWG
jgi:hypothetical protein